MGPRQVGDRSPRLLSHSHKTRARAWLEAKMAEHKYAVGQSVRFIPDRLTEARARGIYTVVRILPEMAGVWQYRIKAKLGGQERVVREYQLQRPT